MKKAAFVVISFLSSLTFAQTVNYDDVAVIINSNSQTSIDIANYFQAARNIPAQNMIYISSLTSEEIDSTQFEAIRVQIEDHLINNNLVNSINYLVTTSGVPLKVINSCYPQLNTTFSCASFDSELSLILGAYSSEIGKPGGIANPILESTQHFSKSAFDVYLVTRLTAYTKQDVYNLIDRSGPETGLNRLTAQAVLDINNAIGGDSLYFRDNFITPAEDYLTNNSWNSIVDADTTPAQNEQNVFAYMSYEFGDSYGLDLNSTWTNGSVGSISTCNSASTFELSSATGNQILLGDLIAEGCTAAHGYVNCNYFGLIFRSHIFFDRYLNPTENYNLAESFYMAEPRMSWQGVVVGDPKASVVVDNTAGQNELDELTLSLYPNPTNGVIHISSSEMISAVEVYSTNGVLMKSIAVESSLNLDVDLTDLNSGVYFMYLNSEDKTNVKRVVLTK